MKYERKTPKTRAGCQIDILQALLGLSFHFFRFYIAFVQTPPKIKFLILWAAASKALSNPR